MNPAVELVLKHKKANMRKSEFLMLEALKSAPHLNDTNSLIPILFYRSRIFQIILLASSTRGGR